MAAYGRTMTFPLALGLGARPMDVPGRGAVLCISAFLPFRMSDGETVRPAQWHEAVSSFGGDAAVPDAMAPLPGAEVLLLGAVPPVRDDYREAALRCGSVSKEFLLRPDRDAPDAPLRLGPEAAAWHKEDNPQGRGGPEDERRPLILDRANMQRPLWLGATPFDHPARLQRIGTAGANIGWPANTEASVLNDAHPAFWAEALHPGEPLVLKGLADADVETRLPPYRVAITTTDVESNFVAQPTRIHAVTLIPAADLAAVIWRAAVDLGDDVLGENIIMVVAALEDMHAPARDALHWMGIAFERIEDPTRALDDRPLLPPALAEKMPEPFDLPEGSESLDGRIADAEAWMKKETGAPEDNPFADSAPEEAALADKMQEAAAGDGSNPPNSAAIAAMAKTAMAAGKRKHEKRGFPAPVEPESGEELPPPDPVARGAGLAEEIERRLRAPFQSQHEVELARQLRTQNQKAESPFGG